MNYATNHVGQQMISYVGANEEQADNAKDIMDIIESLFPDNMLTMISDEKSNVTKRTRKYRVFTDKPVFLYFRYEGGNFYVDFKQEVNGSEINMQTQVIYLLSQKNVVLNFYARCYSIGDFFFGLQLGVSNTYMFVESSWGFSEREGKNLYFFTGNNMRTSGLSPLQSGISILTAGGGQYTFTLKPDGSGTTTVNSTIWASNDIINWSGKTYGWADLSIFVYATSANSDYRPGYIKWGGRYRLYTLCAKNNGNGVPVSAGKRYNVDGDIILAVNNFLIIAVPISEIDSFVD